MAVTPTFNNSIDQADGSLLVVTWVLTTANPTGLAIQLPEWADKTVSIFESGDAIGSPAAVWTIQGANADVDANYGTLNNAAGGSPLTATATTTPKIAGIIENPVFVRPNLTTPGTGAITIRFTIRRAYMQRQ